MIKLSVLSNELTLWIGDHAARQLIRFGGALWEEKPLPFNRVLWEGVHKLSGIRCSAIRIRYYNSFGTLRLSRKRIIANRSHQAWSVPVWDPVAFVRNRFL